MSNVLETRHLVPEGAAQGLDRGGVALCFAGTFLLRTAAAAGGTLIALYLASLSQSGFHVPARLVGLTAVLFYAAELVGSPGFGILSDLKGRKPFMVLGPVFGGVAVQLLLLSPAIALVLLARMLQGLSTATSVPSTLSYLSIQTGESEQTRGRIMSAFEVVTVVGMAAGLAVGGMLWDALKHSAFIPVVAVYAVSAILFALIRDSYYPLCPARGFGGYLTFLRSGSALRLVPAWIAVNAIVGLWFSHIGFQMAKADDPTQLLVGGFSGREIGLYTGAISLLFVVGIGLWAYSFKWLRSTQIMAIALGGLFVLVVTTLLLNHSYPGEHGRIGMLLGVSCLSLLVVSGFTPAALTYLADMAEGFPEARGSLMGLYSVFLGLGQLLGGGIGGYFADWRGVTGMIVFTAILGVISSVCVAALIQQDKLRIGSGGRDLLSTA